MNDLLVDHTIIPRSDQLNADDMLTGPIVFTIKDVKLVSDPKQPVHISIDQGRQPYKPCLSMRRVIIKVWGKNAKSWVGRSLMLFCEPSVTFGPNKVGGIRISHMSHISEPQSMMLTTTRGRRAEYTVYPLIMTLEQCTTQDELIAVWGRLSSEDKTRLTALKDELKAKLP